MEKIAFQEEFGISPVTMWLCELLLLCGTMPFEILLVGGIKNKQLVVNTFNRQANKTTSAGAIQ